MSATRSRRSYNGSDPTAAAVLFARRPAAPPVPHDIPPGGVTMTPAARRQAVARGLRPYEIAGLQRQVASLHKRSGEGGSLQVRTHQVFYADHGGLFAITRVM